MLRLLLLALLAGVLLRAFRARADMGAERIRRSLGGFAVAAALARILRALARAAPAPWMTGMLAVVAGIAGAVALAELFWLVEKRSRRRDHVVRAVILFAALSAAWSGPASLGGVSAVVTCGVLAWRWRDALSTRELFATSMGGLGLVVVAALTTGPDTPPAGHAVGAFAAAGWALSRVAWTVSLAYVVMGLFPVVGAFLRDPSLGIHTVRRRLALSHLLVLLVPLLITIALWTLTTWLGVGAERAMTGKRVLEREAASLQAELAGSLAGPFAAAAPTQLGRVHGAEWPGLRVWQAAEGAPLRLVRALGDSIAFESRLAGWLAQQDSLPHAGLVQIGGRRYLGAIASAPGRGALAALVPVPDVLNGAASRLAGARLLMSERVAIPETTSARTPAKRTGGGIRVNGTSRVRQPAVVVYGDESDTLETSDATFSPQGIRGMALLDGIEERGGRFRKTEFSLRAQVPFGATLLGLYQNLRENPLSIVPIAVLGLLVALLLPVALFNFRLVGGLGRSFTEPVAALRAATEALAEGHLEHRVRLDGDDELWQTAAAFNTMAEGLERGRTLEQERVRFENELELARRIQARLLPAGPPEAPFLEIAGAGESAREVGGDYYDHLVLPDGRVLLVIADVSGKGVPAALLMSAFRAAIMSQDSALTDPPRLAERLNTFLHRSVESGRFVTAFFALVEPATGAVQYVNAGHNPALLLRADGAVEWLATGGLILGIVASTVFERGACRLAAGDLLVLYTDGVTEGADATAEQFGEERLVAAVRRLAARPCAEVAAALVREVRAFEGESGPADDITLLVARRLPNG